MQDIQVQDGFLIGTTVAAAALLEEAVEIATKQYAPYQPSNRQILIIAKHIEEDDDTN